MPINTPPLTPMQEISIIRNGLTKTKFPKKIIVVGAGVSGLVSASLLKAAGHHVTIIEASNRIGGHIFTARSPFSPGYYIDVGPMRIPNTHYLTLAYIRKFGLPLNPFINTTPNDLIYANGIKTRRSIYDQNPDILRYPVAPHERGKTADQLADLAVKPITDFISKDPVRNWEIVIKNFDKYSMDYFLRYNPVSVSLSLGAINMMYILLAFEGYSELSFLDNYRDILIFSPSTRFFEITGGFDQFPQAFLPQLKENIILDQKITKIYQDTNKVTVFTTHTKTSAPAQYTGDAVIVTIPYPLLQFVELEPFHSFSYDKRKAIRQLNYLPATKIGIEFKRRFWEDEGLFGGHTETDLPIRASYFPSHRFSGSGGVILASYTWGDAASPWDSLTEAEQLQNTLDNLAEIHGPQVYREFVAGKAQNWANDPFSAGAFAFLKPFQETELSPYASTPEGRVFFAGEHISHYRSWIQGAIESAIRAANEVNQAPFIHNHSQP